MKRILLINFIILSLGTFLLTAPLFAQTPPAQGKDKQKTEQKGDETTQGEKKQGEAQDTLTLKKESEPKEESVIDLISKGGWTMLGLGIITVIIIGFSLERAFYFKRQQIDTKGYYKRIEGALQDGGVDQVEAEIAHDNLLISKILRSGLAFKSAGAGRVEKAIENSASVEVGKLERGLNLLSNLGNLAPLIGFFGTVVGMRESFLQFVNKAAPTAKDLAIGVETALITTAAGLLVAIPAYLIYNLFIYYIDSFNIELERNASAITSELE